MRKLSRYLLIGAVIIEAMVIVLLVTTQKRLAIVRSSVSALPPLNPLELAIEYEASDRRFEEIVRQYPYLISARTSIKGVANSPALADCALLQRTNYVKILIGNGANVEDAMSFLEKLEASDAIDVIREAQSESRSKPSK